MPSIAREVDVKMQGAVLSIVRSKSHKVKHGKTQLHKMACELWITK